MYVCVIACVWMYVWMYVCMDVWMYGCMYYVYTYKNTRCEAKIGPDDRRKKL